MNKTIKGFTASIALTLGLSVLATNASASTHTIVKGETLSEIAHSNGVSLQSLINSNPQIKNINLIYAGETLNIGTTSQVKQKTYQSQNVAATTTSSDVYLLAGLIESEAGGESFNGKVAVGQVVMNRVYSSQFPNSVQGVIYQSGQFAAPTTPSAESIAAAKSAMSSGYTGILYFYNPTTSTTNLAASHTVVKQVGKHVFLR